MGTPIPCSCRGCCCSAQRPLLLLRRACHGRRCRWRLDTAELRVGGSNCVVSLHPIRCVALCRVQAGCWPSHPAAICCSCQWRRRLRRLLRCVHKRAGLGVLTCWCRRPQLARADVRDARESEEPVAPVAATATSAMPAAGGPAPPVLPLDLKATIAACVCLRRWRCWTRTHTYLATCVAQTIQAAHCWLWTRHLHQYVLLLEPRCVQVHGVAGVATS